MSERDDKWADRYGETHNKKRRERYQNDPAYREKIKKQAREYKRKRNRYREYNGKEYRVYRAGDIKETLGITQSQYLWMRERGVFPASVFEGEQHRISAGQLNYLKKLWDQHPGEYDKLKTELHANWMSVL